jgi:hypothetical protein
MLQDSGQADDNIEIQITPPMVESGIAALREFHFGESEARIVEAIYLAMALEAPIMATLQPL